MINTLNVGIEPQICHHGHRQIEDCSRASRVSVCLGIRQNRTNGVNIKEPINRTMHVDIEEMREIMSLAARRVSAFVHFGLDELYERGGGDLNLTSDIQYKFWDDEITKENRDAARETYQTWLVGSCLKELDLFYGLFLDKLWFAIEVAELHGTTVPLDHKFDQEFAKMTNIANKQRKVAARFEAADHHDVLNSLSLARNALSHHTGIVRSPRDCNNVTRDTLTIKWMAFDILANRDGEERVVVQNPFDTHTMPGDGPVKMSMHYTHRELAVPAGNQIKLTKPQIAELCMFYKILCDKTIEGLVSFLKEKGLGPVGDEASNGLS